MTGRRSEKAAPVLPALLAAAGLAAASGAVAAESRKPYAESEEVAPSSQLAPCSQRIPALRTNPLSVAQDPEDALKSALGAGRFLGVKENVGIRPGGIGGGGMLRVRYPEGSINFGSADDGKPLGGASFYVPFTAGRAACLHYEVRFPADFEFAKGGKLPGLYAGKAPSGGDKVSGRNGWSVRLMWREDGAGELYEYVYNKKGKYGLSVGRGTFSFPRDRWVGIDLEVIVNDPDQRNGKARLWIDGRPVIQQDDIVFVTKQGDAEEKGLMFSTFFGGNDKSWASPKDQHVDFANFRFHAEEAR
jgi:hypothetical protein